MINDPHGVDCAELVLTKKIEVRKTGMWSLCCPGTQS